MRLRLFWGWLLLPALALTLACGGAAETITVVETVVVEKQVKGDTIVETVVVEVEKVVRRDPVVVVATPTPAPKGPVPRNRIFVMPMGGTIIANHDNFNPYALGNQLQRFVLSKGFNEMMFYGNLNTGEQIPWQAESWSLAADNKTVTIKVRDGVKWSDGTKFSAHDIVFTLNEINGGGSTQGNLVNVPFETGAIASIRAIDDMTVELVQDVANPRWFWKNFGISHENHVPIMPKHIWEGQDLETFKFYDPAKNWPVNTGAFELVSSSPQQIIMQRKDDWWGVESGFWPKTRHVEQLIFVPSGDGAATTQMIINNEAETSILDVGDFLAAKARNPKLRSWFRTGPIWGPSDGCVFRFTPNNLKPPWDNADLRRALQYATNRDQIVELALEGSVNTAVLPFAEYGGVQAYIEPLQDLIAQYNPGEYNLDKSAELMTSLGYAKDSGGFWAKDGERLTFTANSAAWRAHHLPPAVQQWRDAGFDVDSKSWDGDSAMESLLSGEWEIYNEVHCGSLTDPFETLNDFHSKWSRPLGENQPYRHATSRMNNPEYDAIIDKMEVLEPSPTDPEYTALVREAVEIYLQEVPEIVWGEERHAVTFNETYWTNYATDENPYAAPFFCCWSSPYLIILQLLPTQ